MKIFIIGLPKSGCTTVSKGLITNGLKLNYIHAMSWFNSKFDDSVISEHQAIKKYFDVLKLNPLACIDYVREQMKVSVFEKSADDFIIDGILNPYDFVDLFDYNKDVVVFLNRTDAVASSKDHEGVAVNVMRDYCLYLATVNLLTKNRWLEFNYKIPGEESDLIKHLGKHSTVTITKSINKSIEHLTGELCKLLT